MTVGLQVGHIVSLTIPADTAYVGVARSVVAGLAARLDLDLDAVEDLRLATSEACSLVLTQVSEPTGVLTVEVSVLADGVGVAVTARAPGATAPSPESFGWTVLSALADDVSAGVDADQLRLTMVLRGDVTAAPAEEARARRS